MLIRFIKGKNKPDTLACLRADGSRTWSALNVTAHDFGHYAVETTLGWRGAFFGLLAQGWDIADFGKPDPATNRKPAVPTQAMQAEIMAGLLDLERRSADPPAYALLLELLASACGGLGVPVPSVTPDQLAAIRVCHADLLRRWTLVPGGASLELSF